MKDNATDENLRYEIVLNIRHPSLTPDEIGNELNLDPDIEECVGMPRQTPSGHKRPGVFSHTRWMIWERRLGDRLFFKNLSGRMLNHLEEHGAFLRYIVGSGGEVDLIVYLPGDVNIGDTISSGNLARLAALGISLGLEVFPKMNPEPEELIWVDDP